MNSDKTRSELTFTLRLFVIALMAGIAPLTQAAVTVWTGAPITFTQQPSSDPLEATNQDRLTPYVWLTRDVHDRMFNAKTETSCRRGFSPQFTGWASGTLADDYEHLGYTDFSTWVDNMGGGHVYQLIIGVDAVVRITTNGTDFIYFTINFSDWAHDSVGGYTYTRSTPAATVTIASPVDGAVLAAPATVKIEADTSSIQGAVTNVMFFENTTSIGSDQTLPFSITTSNLPAGPYAFTAVATAAEVSSTSAVVNITVVSPVAITLMSQVITNNQFSFNYTANPGLTYVVENSSNLVNWLPVVTNVASSNPVHFAGASVPDGTRYYRVGRQANP